MVDYQLSLSSIFWAYLCMEAKTKGIIPRSRHSRSMRTERTNKSRISMRTSHCFNSSENLFSNRIGDPCSSGRHDTSPFPHPRVLSLAWRWHQMETSLPWTPSDSRHRRRAPCFASAALLAARVGLCSRQPLAPEWRAGCTIHGARRRPCCRHDRPCCFVWQGANLLTDHDDFWDMSNVNC